MKSTFTLVALSLLCLTGTLPAQPKAPPPPAQYLIDIRYEIDAFPNERSAQFKEMVQYFKDNGFVRDRDDADTGKENNEEVNRAATRMRGTIPSGKLAKLLAEPHVVTVKIVPEGKPLPAPDQPVRVDLLLATGVNADRQRILARELAAILAKLGFKEATGYDHRNHARLLGTIPAGQLETLLTDVRRHPQALATLPPSLLKDMRSYDDGEAILQVVLPEWYKSAEGKKFIAPLIVDWRKEAPAIRYMNNLTADILQLKEVVDGELFEQMIRHPDGAPYLERLMAGALKSPAAQELLEPIIRRVRGRAVAGVLPPLFRPRTVVRTVEARPDLPLPKIRPAEVKVPDDQRKLSPEVRALALDAAESVKLRRLEIILSKIPDAEGRGWARDLERIAPDLQIEGRLGAVVSALVTPKSAAALVALTQVSSIRLPHPAHSTVWTFPQAEGVPADALKLTGLNKIHDRGQKGKKVRLAVIDSDFRGWQAEVGKRLPAKTQLVDLTLERNVNFLPDPFPGDPKEIGTGTQMALAAMLAAPEADLTLIRVDPAAPHLVGLAARRIAGQRYETDALRRRGEEMNEERILLNTRRKELNAERRRILDKFPDNRPGGDIFMIQKQKELDAYEKAEAAFKVLITEHVARTERLLQYREALDALANVRVTVNGLVWHDGHLVNGTSGLSALLDELAECDRLWFQPTGSLPGQVWSGLHLDADGNGRMNFIADAKKQAEGTWDGETNFLGWVGRDGKTSNDIPAGTKVRLTLQWTESHDADFGKVGDPYRQPLSSLRLVVLKQLDPTGTKQPSDDLDFVKQSEALPQRLRGDSTSATYEHVVEFTAEAGVRYIVSVEGTPATGTAPERFPTNPLGGRSGEIRPRVHVASDATAGQPLFISYNTESGSLGSPADALRLFTVGAADGTGKPRRYSGRGSPYGVEMVTRPEIIAPDRFGLEGIATSGGTGMSAALSAGWAATLLSGKQTPQSLGCYLRQSPAQLLRIQD